VFDHAWMRVAGPVGQHAAAIRGDPHRVCRNLQEIAYGGLLGTLQVAAEFRYRMPLAVGVAEYRSSLAAACPQAAGLVLMDGPDLVLEDGGHRAGGMLRAHEVAAVGMAHEQAVAVAQ